MAIGQDETVRLLAMIAERLAAQQMQIERLDQQMALLLDDQRRANEKLTRLRLFLENKMP